MRLLVLVLALLIAGPAFAINEWTMCGGSPSSSSRVGDKECKEFRFDSTFSTGSTEVRITAETAVISLIPDLDAAPVGSAVVMVKKCISGITTAQLTNGCADILGSALTGVGGSASTQLHSIRVGPGLYQLDVTTASAASDLSVLQVQGE